MKYNVISKIKFDTPIDEDTVEEFQIFSNTPSISSLNLKIFADADANGIQYDEEYINGEKSYTHYRNYHC